MATASLIRTTGPSAWSSIDVLVAAHAQRIPAAPAIIAPGRPTLTYGRLRAQIDDTSHVLQGMGFSRDDRLALVLPNGPELAVAILAVTAGAICAPLNPAHSAHELDSHLAKLDATAVVVQAGFASPARSVAESRGIAVVELSPVTEAEAGIFRLGTENPIVPRPLRLPQPHDVALLLLTAGTTSQPRVVPLTHNNIGTSAHSIREALALVEDDRCLNLMPLFHSHGLMGTLLPSLVTGASIICPSRFDVAQFFGLLETCRPTWYTAVPTIHAEILARAPAYREVIPRCPLRFVRSGSASLAPSFVKELEGLFKAPVIEFYGMTEAASQITCNPLPPGERKPGSVGVAAGPDVAILDAAGAFLPAGHTGEIAVRGANIMQGYDHDPLGSGATFTHGWLRTGDQGHLDADAHLFITGRLKEIINRGGEKISPRAVEDVLTEHPAVAEVVVFPIPHPELGEDVAAGVVLRESASATASEIRKFAATRLAHFAVPRRIVFLEKIPSGPIGKVQRTGLAERLGLLPTNRTPPTATCAVAESSTPVQSRLAVIWGQVLGLSHVGPQDDFFELGGHSLQAVELCAEIERVFAKSLPPAILFQAPTVQQLTEILSMEDAACRDHKASGGCSVVAIRSGGSKPPFFCVHPHGGNVIVFNALAARLGPDQPFYALQVELLTGHRAPHRGIEDLAAKYVRDIRTIQSSGPYFIGGYCFGATLAFEMAHHLHRQGQTVGALAMIDAYAPDHSPFRQWARRATHRIARHLGTLARLGARERFDYLVAKAGIIAGRIGMSIKSARKRDRDTEPSVIGALREVQAAHAWAYRHYAPKPYPGAMMLFRPSHQPGERGRDCQMGWGGLATGGLDVYEVPGRHLSIIAEPFVKDLADKLRAGLHKAQAYMSGAGSQEKMVDVSDGRLSVVDDGSREPARDAS